MCSRGCRQRPGQGSISLGTRRWRAASSSGLLAGESDWFSTCTVLSAARATGSMVCSACCGVDVASSSKCQTSVLSGRGAAGWACGVRSLIIAQGKPVALPAARTAGNSCGRTGKRCLLSLFRPTPGLPLRLAEPAAGWLACWLGDSIADGSAGVTWAGTTPRARPVAVLAGLLSVPQAMVRHVDGAGRPLPHRFFGRLRIHIMRCGTAGAGSAGGTGRRLALSRRQIRRLGKGADRLGRTTSSSMAGNVRLLQQAASQAR
jgi:hypothetical protein